MAQYSPRRIQKVKVGEGISMDTSDFRTTEMKRKTWIKEIISWILVVGVGFLLAWFVTRVIIIKAVVPTESMEPTIMIGDKMIGNRLSYLFSDPDRGDIIIFKFSETENYVKRIIGLPGETVTLKDGKVFIDGVVLEEDYIHGQITEPQDQDTYVVPEDSYFMLGDNRVNSADSRYWDDPFISKDAIKGKVWFRYSPSWGTIK